MVFIIPTKASSKFSALEFEKTSSMVVTKDMLQAKIDNLNSRQGIDAITKSKVLAIYQSAKDNLIAIENFRSRSVEFNLEIKKAPETTKNLQKKIARTLQNPSAQSSDNFNHLSAEELNLRLVIEKGKISSLDEQIKKLGNELVLQQHRPQLMRDESVNAMLNIDSIQKNQDVANNNADSELEDEARQFYVKSLVVSHAAELKMLNLEAISNPYRVDLIKTELHLLDIQKNDLIKASTAINNQLTMKRQQEVKEMQDAVIQEEKELSGKDPLIQALTHENVQYNLDLLSITTKIENCNEQKSQLERQGSGIDNDYKSAEKKISLAGLSPALGNILREQRRSLLTQDQSSLLSETILNETALTSLEQFQIESKVKQFINVETELKQMMRQILLSVPIEQRMAIQAELRALLNNKIELLNKLAIVSTTYLRLLGDLDFARQQTDKQAKQFATYLDENLLWVKSADPIATNNINDLLLSIEWLLAPHHWLNSLEDLVNITKHNPLPMTIGIVSLMLLLLSKKWLQNQLMIIAIEIEHNRTDSFICTLQALVYTLLFVLPLPLFGYYLGWILSSNVHVVDFTKAVGKGLQNASLSLLFLQFFYLVFADEGIASQHFKWHKNNTLLLRKQIAWFRFIAVITAFIIHCTAASNTPIYSDNLGRLTFIINMIAMMVFSSRLLNPSSGLLKSAIDNANELLIKMRYVWFLLVISTPLIIIGFAIAGYYLSALELQAKLILSLRLIFMMIIFHELVIRWLTLVNRQIITTNVKQKLKTAVISEQHLPESEEPILTAEEQIIDIPKINAQTIRLLDVFIGFALMIGFWIILKNILPAFSFLEDIVLWQHLVISNNHESYQPITLTNLILAGVYFFIVLVSVRNFSGVMELIVFSRLTIEPGRHYAVNQLAKYSLLTIGFIFIGNELGGSWSQIQWLVAAISVGLGFGVQEIFANIVSGVILLIERPIRIGDTISIDCLTGKVSRIQIRATTLLDTDQKNLLVPNKTFITNPLINWTLSNPIHRIDVAVGIAYGTGVELALKVMINTVKSIAKVLIEPLPKVFFIGFGENSLTFSISVFVNELSNRTLVIHDLHIGLEKAFRENKIEIPLPQRDVHIQRN